ncbi:MAG: hypothetical protein BWZ01_01383 [Deltaproteobacteria bacterium ADurb.BinA179]|nr:MAG: hypothetical protein BWZ01_01383 [Deltaproteobacteria bacterium ADurb.BinA179]
MAAARRTLSCSSRTRSVRSMPMKIMSLFERRTLDHALGRSLPSFVRILRSTQCGPSRSHCSTALRRRSPSVYNRARKSSCRASSRFHPVIYSRDRLIILVRPCGSSRQIMAGMLSMMVLRSSPCTRSSSFARLWSRFFRLSISLDRISCRVLSRTRVSSCSFTFLRASSICLCSEMSRPMHMTYPMAPVREIPGKICT